MVRLKMLGVAVVAGTLAACSGGGGITTSSLLGTSEAPAPVDEPTDRALHAAATSARASKCGYNFDPGRLRETFLAAEASRGAPPEQMTRLGQTYDYTRATVSKQIANAEEYCTEAQTREISAALGKQLAGDFSAPRRAPVKPRSWWGEASQAPMDREAVFNPMGRN